MFFTSLVLCNVSLSSWGSSVASIRPNELHSVRRAVSTFLNQPSLATSEDIVALEHFFESFQGVRPEWILGEIFDQALQQLKNSNISDYEKQRAEAILRVAIYPGADFDPSDIQATVKQNAFELIALVAQSRSTEKALINRVAGFRLWSAAPFNWVEKQIVSRAGFLLIYSGMKDIDATLDDEQRLTLAKKIRETQKDSFARLAVLFQLGQADESDIRGMLNFGAKHYARTLETSSAQEGDSWQLREEQALIGELYELAADLRTHRTLRQVFEEEKAKAISEHTIFSKHAQFYAVFLRPNFKFGSQASSGTSAALPTAGKVISLASFRKNCDEMLK